MSPKVALAALLLASVPLAGLADDSSSENKTDNQSQKLKRDSSDIRRSKEERRDAYDKHTQNRGKDSHKGGRNPSPDA